ncbi:MAG: D-alanyl-D-alanine carboxypeptidase family protein [Suipraeoptans sp.]
MSKVYKVLMMIMILTICSGVPIESFATENVVEEDAVAENGPIDGTTEVGTTDELIEQAHQLPIDSNTWKNWPTGPATEGRAAIVMEAGTGTILYAKGIDDKEYPASITKVLTALVTLENANLDDNVTISAESIGCLLPYYAHVGLKEGNVLPLRDTLYATLLASANEAAYATGEGVGVQNGQDYDWFIDKMNETCKEIGANNSNFINTNGMPDENHYTTARDMALIMKELYQYPEYFDMSSTLSYKIDASDTVEEHVFQHSDKMLYAGNEEYYEYATSGKTGYTEQSRSTLVTTAEKDGMQLICVVLHTYGSNSYNNTKALFDYAFDNFVKVSMNSIGENEYIKDYKDSDNTYLVLPKEYNKDNLRGDIVFSSNSASAASVDYYYGDNRVGMADVEVTQKYLEDNDINSSVEFTAERKIDTTKSSVLKSAAIVAVIIIIALVLFSIYTNHMERKRRRTRRRRRRSQ